MSEPTTEPISGPAIGSLAAVDDDLRSPPERFLIDGRVLRLCGLAVLVALLAALAARLLTALIALCTNLAWFGALSTAPRSPADNHLGLVGALVPVLGGLLVGLMARYGSAAIRGHGIPEAMEQVLLNKSRIPARVTVLKPLSAAISIGTGGPFGAEGPIIATGGALGSLLGQLLHTTAGERKTLLAAGAAAGMTATFGSPVAAVLLAVELLLFELRPRSLIPVALAAAVATAVRIAFVGTAPAFTMAEILRPTETALALYAAVGAVVGLAAVLVTRAVYAVEDAFARLPLHWAFWPALGGVAVGLCGLFEPRSLGVGYDNIDGVLGGALAGRVLVSLVVFKLLSWLIALGSGTSGGTLAPLFTIGGGLGALLATASSALLPHAGIDPRIGALVGMAAMFAGASRALLTSVVFAFETTRQPLGLLPLLAGCSVSYLLSCLLMKNSIMTEKIARRGVLVPAEQSIDFLELITAGTACTRQVVPLRADQPLSSARAFLSSLQPGHGHQGFPVLDGSGLLCGVVTRRDLLDPAAPPDALVASVVRRAPSFCFEENTLREAADLMVRAAVGRLPVVSKKEPRRVLGMLSRSDLLAAHASRLDDLDVSERSLQMPGAR
jgi:H+/Cl- antiporter ClcA/CBS domain-containing protein